MAAQLLVAGRGKVGRSLAGALNRAGHPTRLVAARTGVGRLVRDLGSEPQSIVFVAVPDDAVGDYARSLAAADVPASVAFVHVSGALGLDALDALVGGHAVGSFHPLRSFPSPQPPEAFRGIVITIDASRASLARRLRRLARDLGATPRAVVDRDRVIYHAAAVFASNYEVALLQVAVDLLGTIGWNEREAVGGLLPLMSGAIQHAREAGPAASLTGPIRRGDAGTVEQHLAALESLDRKHRAEPPVADLYRMLGEIALELAKDAGLAPAAAERVSRALTRKVAATRRRRRR